MKQFFETYVNTQIVSSSMSQLKDADNDGDGIVTSGLTQLEMFDLSESILSKTTWTNHLVLISRTKSEEERAFYLNLCISENYKVKELERQISAGF